MSLTSRKFIFKKWLLRHIEWSKESFGPGYHTEGLLKHIRKELDEIEKYPMDLYEWVDVIILAVDGAWRRGYTVDDIILAMKEKQQINFARKWPRITDQSEPTDHIKEVT